MGTLRRLHRFAQHRATTRVEQQWAAHWIDLLEAGLATDHGTLEDRREGPHTAPAPPL